AIPQISDTAALVKLLDLTNTKTKLLAIIANERGAKEACEFEEIEYLGFPFSVSETFQQRNTNSTMKESLSRVESIQNLCEQNKKQAVVYLSMGFGNPYGDDWNIDILSKWTEELIKKGIKILSLADTTGVSTVEKIEEIYPYLLNKYPQIEWGMHLHSIPETSFQKIQAAFNAGCNRMDSAVKGFGGCPMATDDLTGNIATENVLSYLKSQDINLNINEEAWEEAYLFSSKIFDGH
ncbi:MAG: hydroxymethylglutaryl-CoA lyase, partial [Ferruginibacter sp.]|nr:hydroxymethylglutaryl-CoA lyase [Ferruginibacter sp.]